MKVLDEHIQALHNKFLAGPLLAMKYSVLKERLSKWIPTVFELAVETDKNLQTSLIVYIFVNSELSERQIIELVTSLSNQIKETVMSTLDNFVEKGRKEAELKGKEKTDNAVKNLIKLSVLTDQQIASAFEVTTDYVAEIRLQLSQQK